jgi:IS30 family transposase
MIACCASSTVSAITEILIRLDPSMRRAVTFDNGAECAKHSVLKEAPGITTFFCNAYASWQRGGAENANGRIRRWLPRKTNLDDMTDEEIQNIAMSINITPGKCLRFKFPVEAFLNELGKDMTIRFNTNLALH